MKTTSSSAKTILHSPSIRPAAVLAVLLLAAAPLHPDTAEGPPEGALWVHAGISFVFTPDREGVLHDAALSLGAEYGVLPWASFSAHWRPGIILWADNSGGPAGRVSDIAFSIRTGLLGEGALITHSFLRLALLAGVNTPLPSGRDTVREPGPRLWGALLGVSFDYIPLSLFQVNFSAAAALNPEQASTNPAFRRGFVRHPLDLRLELEPRFAYPVPNGVIVTLPLRYEMSVESKVRGVSLGDEGHVLSLGLGCAALIRSVPLPFEAGVKFLAPLYRANRPDLIMHLELYGKIELPVKKGARHQISG
ncbi:MAG: hypothetical protein LBP23_04030 [Treponema sp.]|jgi:hypothetical protein|nr:hypothetical protein [Treponema sp.]